MGDNPFDVESFALFWDVFDSWCSQCGNVILDPYCEDACPGHLCSECGMKCSESRSPNEDEWPDPDKCQDCPYEVDPEYDEPPELTEEEIQESIAEQEAEIAADGEESPDW